LTTATFTNLSLANRIHFQNFNTTGLNLANWQFTYQKRLIAFQTNFSNFPRIQSKHRFQWQSRQSLPQSLHKIFQRNIFTKIRRDLRFFNLNLIHSQWLVQANHRNLVNTILGLDHN
jgi:hypothetical protein